MYDTILVPTDGSDHSIRAAEQGQYLARLFDATIHVITAVDVPEEPGESEAGKSDVDVSSELESPGEKAIEAVKARISETDLIQTAVINGDPTEVILEYAEDHDIDLITMGTHGRTGLTRFIAGSVTEHVVRLADIPVLTTHANQSEGPNRDYEEILIPTDGSEPAAAAIDHGLAIAEKANARVHVVNIVDLGGMMMSPHTPPRIESLKYLEEEGESWTEAIATRAREAGLNAVTEVHEGVPAGDLLKYTEENGIDLIVMGTTGRTGLDRFLLGSTTERIVRLAEMPVLAVKAQNESDMR